MKHIPKPNSFSGILASAFFFFNEAKKSSIAVATVSFFNADKGKKGRSKTRKVVWFGYLGGCLLLVLYSAVAFSQEPLDSVVYPEVKIEAQRISQTIGSNVSETDSLLYSLLKSKGLTQILETESFISTRSYSPGGIANFSIRGTGSQHTQVLWNGIPINDPMLGQTDLSTISLSGISNVRVLYGSAGLTNNSGGIGGSIELISAPPRSKNGFEGNVNISAGSFGTYGFSIQLRDRYKKLFGTTAFEYRTAKNNFRYRNLATIAQEEKQLEHALIKQLGFTKTVGVDINRKNRLSLNVYYAQVRRELPPTMLTTSTEETLFDRDIWAAIKWRRIGKRSVINLTASYIYGKQEYSDNNGYTFNHLYLANKNLIRYKLNLGHNIQLEIGGDVFAENAKSDSAYRNQPRWRYWQAAFASLKYEPKK
ncbi:MAG: TonB-dependent receptor plug domain-containing protein, partial [Flavobacteriales bacterium]|nr:TonB-dependent receptor plug domain-containing protein [Flavobacteriales bacterium]